MQSPWYHSSQPSQPLEKQEIEFFKGTGSFYGDVPPVRCSHHEPWAIGGATDAVRLILLFEYRGYLGLALWQIELASNFPPDLLFLRVAIESYSCGKLFLWNAHFRIAYGFLVLLLVRHAAPRSLINLIINTHVPVSIKLKKKIRDERQCDRSVQKYHISQCQCFCCSICHIYFEDYFVTSFQGSLGRQWIGLWLLGLWENP